MVKSVAVETKYDREVKVSQGVTGIFIQVQESTVNRRVQAVLTADEAKQLGTALLQAAEGKLQEPKYYLHVHPEEVKCQYLNIKHGKELLLENKTQNSRYQTQFTQEEIDSNSILKPFEQFKVLVPADELV